jgi:hypothetical protein
MHQERGDFRYDDAYRCGFCQGRVYIAGNVTQHYRCANCGLAPVSLIQPNSHDEYVALSFKKSEIALLYASALRNRDDFEWYSVVIRNKWEDIINKLGKSLDNALDADEIMDTL